MRQLLFLCIASFLATSITAQNTTNESDPEATKILESIKKEYLSYSSMEIDFTLTLAFPEEAVETQKGTIAQQGEKYRLKMEGREMISDGYALWMYMEDRNEVQINDVEEEDSDEVNLLSPKALFTLYEKGDYIYGITNEGQQKGRSFTQIEFKPTDRYSEYTKLRLTVDKKSNQLMSMEVFSKDGSKYILNIDKLKSNQDFSAKYFTFNKADYPGVKVEDVRM